MAGGEYATSPLQFPYQVSIHREPEGHWCGGGIIGETWILTAAHCFVDYENGTFVDVVYTVVAGVLNAYAKGDHVIKVQVGKIYIPTEFSPVNPDANKPYRAIGDIAVVEVIHLGRYDILN